MLRCVTVSNPRSEGSNSMTNQGFVQIDGVEYVAASEVSRQVEVSRQTLWRWRREGKIPSGHRYRDGRVLFTLEELHEIREHAFKVEPIDEESQDQMSLFQNGGAAGRRS